MPLKRTLFDAVFFRRAEEITCEADCEVAVASLFDVARPGSKLVCCER